MGRVETRMYRRRQRRAKWRRWLVAVAVAAGICLLLQQGNRASMIAEYIGLPEKTMNKTAFDTTPGSREVTLPAETWYAIQTGIFSTQEAALQKADAYTQRGAPGTVIRQGEKWRVFIACYGSEAEAAAVRTRLENNQKVDTYLYVWACPEIRLRLSGMAGQLDAAEAGFTLLKSAAAVLRDTAVEIDAAQLTIQEAKDAAKALGEQIVQWEDTARACFGREIPPLIEEMLKITAGWKARYKVLAAAEDATALSAAYKAQAMGLYDEICTWRQTLAAQ